VSDSSTIKQEPYSNKQLVGYGLLRMPLALIELPLFLFLPSLYAGTHGMSLTVLSLILFATRFVDAFIDPLVGSLVAKKRDSWGYMRWILCAAPVIGLGFIVLLSPRPHSVSLLTSLIAGSVLTFLAYSVISIAYQAWGADISRNDQEATKIVGVREIFGLVGVVLASSLLRIETIQYLLMFFCVLLVIASVGLRWVPKPVVASGKPTLNATGSAQASSTQSLAPKSLNAANAIHSNTSEKNGVIAQLTQLRTDQRFWRLMSVFLINGIATAIPATLVLFFIEDVIGAKAKIPMYLLAYFLSGAIGMPAWVWACKRLGLEATWLLGMIFSVLAFAWTVGLGPGDQIQFLVVCIVTGLALGADLALPPAILAAVIKAAGKSQSAEASYFGVWSFAIKLNLALAAAISLPLVQWGGYQPGNRVDTLALSMVYAALPCALKLLAGMLLWLRPIVRLS
jgi:glycoside/pentoside/hexuronide:cation symporter, GPH family